MTNNNILLLKLIWLGYTTQHIHHLLKLNPDFFKFSYTDQLDTIRNWDRMFHNDDFIDKFNNLNEKDILSLLQNHKVSFTTPFNTN